MTAGTVLLAGALFLLLYNRSEDSRVQERTVNILEELKAQMPKTSENKNNPYSYVGIGTTETGTPVVDYGNPEEFIMPDNSYSEDEVILPEPDIFAEYENTSVQEVVYWVDNCSYLGVLYIPALGIELPVISDWSYSNLRSAPCRYTGSVEEGNLVIAAHNYSCHFGNISSLSSGDEIIFTDGNGVVHRYGVVNSEIIGGRNIPAMEAGSEDWDITLFTCNLSGSNRITVRAAEITE